LKLNSEYQKHNANYLHKEKEQFLRDRKDITLITDIPSRLSKWPLINITVFKSISTKFKDIIQQCTYCYPRKNLFFFIKTNNSIRPLAKKKERNKLLKIKQHNQIVQRLLNNLHMFPKNKRNTTKTFRFQKMQTSKATNVFACLTASLTLISPEPRFVN